jgi:hypothetical protein
LSEITEKTSIKIPLIYVVPAVIALISFGGIVDRLMTGEERRNELKEYLLEEVSGLRADWERDRAEQNRRLNKLEQ